MRGGVREIENKQDVYRMQVKGLNFDVNKVINYFATGGKAEI